MGDSKKKILMVEDEAPVRELVKSLAEARGYTFFEAPDGQKGVEAAKKHHPDIILMDVNMPKMTGFQALEKLKSDKKTQNIPVIMLTTRDTQEDMSQGMELYADKYIPKPFNSEHLFEEIRKTLGAQGL